MQTIGKDYIIDSDGITVWVNGPIGMIGRFGHAGIDIHTKEHGECLYCTHAWTKAEDWPVFVAKMKELYQIDVPQEHKPKRFNEDQPCPL